MTLSTLTLENFRNHQQTTIAFSSGTTILVGKNAAGKTNILEALHFLTSEHSWRASKEMYLIALGKPHAKVSASYVKSGNKRELIGFMTTNNGRTTKQWRLQGAPTTSQKIAHEIPLVGFKPDDLDELIHAAQARRGWIDRIVRLTERDAQSTYSKYRRVLQQRLAALQQLQSGQIVDLRSLNEQLVQYGSIISTWRVAVINKIAKMFTETFQKISSGQEKINIALYAQEVPAGLTTIGDWQKAYLEVLPVLEQREIAATRNLLGPQRDDLIITKESRPMREIGSRGEWRTTILALKICELNFIEAKLGERPLLFIDDVVSELDEQRRHTLTSVFSQQQTIITTTHLSELPKKTLETSQIYEVCDGIATPAKKTEVYAGA